MTRSENIQNIQTLLRDAKAVDSFHSYYEREIKPVSNIDKKGYGFNRDPRFAAFKAEVSFDSFMGTYGNSSCHPILSVETKLARKHFVKALNKLQHEIFTEMARSMREEAASLTEEAEREIENMQTLLHRAKQEDTQ